MKLSLATRIFLGYAVVLATFAAVSIFSVAQMHRNQQEIQLVSQGYFRLSQETQAIESFHKNQQKETDRLLDEPRPEYRRTLIGPMRMYSPLIAQSISDALGKVGEVLQIAPPFEAAFVRDVEQKLIELEKRNQAYQRAADAIFTTLESGEADREQIAQRAAELKQKQGVIGSDIRKLHAAIENRIRERVEQAAQREKRTSVAIVALSVLAVSVGLLATSLSARALRPVKTLIEGVSRIQRGDYTAQLGVRGADEISTLAREFNAMAKSLREREAQLKEKQEALLRAEQLAAIGRFSAQIAHEVRNPLSSIGLNIELLSDAMKKSQFRTEGEAKEAKDLLSSVIRELDRLTEITEGYLRMARLPKPSLAPEDLNEVIGKVLDFSREELERAKVQVIKRLDPATPRALADEGQLRQVFLNLLRNSREAMAGGGKLLIQSRAVNGDAEVIFADSGRGMSGEVRDRIFEPFFSTKEGGTGLGLAVSRQILQAHGGSIHCESEPGGGATFVIRLPHA